MHEIPVLALAEREHVAEQLLGLGAVEEVLLVRGALIGVARRHRDADAEFGREVEEFCDLFRRMAVEDRGVDVDGKASRLRGLDRGDRAVEHALLADRLVVMFLQAVEMNREEQIGRGLEQMELLLQQQRVGAERDEFLARDETSHDLADLRGSAARRRGSPPSARRIHRPRPSIPAPTCGGSGSHRDSRSCRSRRRRGCSGTTAPASARADSACGQAASA